MKRTYENCSMQRKHGEAGKDANGFCLGFGRGESDDEPCEICKKCKLYTGLVKNRAVSRPTCIL